MSDFYILDSAYPYVASYRGDDAGAGVSYGTASYSSSTFTRASSATYWDPLTNTYTSYATNEARIFDGSILIEGARTNEVPDSESGGTQWVATATETANAGVAPDGATTADEWALSASSSATSGGLMRRAGVTTTNAVPLAVSAFLRGDGDGKACLRVLAGSTYSEDLALDASDWTRFVLLTPSSGASASIGAGNYGWGSGAPWPNAKDLQEWGWQLEESALFASTYIPTSGAAATRALENCRLAEADWAALRAADTWYVDVTPEWPSTEAPASGTTRAIFVAQTGSAALVFYYNGSAWELRLTNDVGTSIEPIGISWDIDAALRVHVDQTAGTVTLENLDTASTDTATSTTAAGGDWTGASGTLAVGSTAGTSDHAFALIGRSVLT